MAKDDELAAEALARLQEITAKSGYDVRRVFTRSRDKDWDRDGTLVISIDGNECHLLIAAKRHATTSTVTRVAMDLESAGIPNDELLFVAQYIQPAVQTLLQSQRFNYLDAAGNCHIDKAPIFIHVEGRKPDKVEPRRKIRAFGGEGLKVIFSFLLDQDLVSETYRNLAELCNVSHGVVQYTINDLEDKGFLDRLGRGKRRLRRTDDLIDRWVEGYIEALRPKLSLGRFRFRDEDSVKEWKDIDLDPHLSRWGGEPAADLITEYLRPGYLTIYTRYSRPEAMKSLRLLPDDAGHLELFRTFWTRELEDHASETFSRPTVPIVLAYADLAASDDPRNAEVAATLRGRLMHETA